METDHSEEQWCADGPLGHQFTVQGHGWLHARSHGHSRPTGSHGETYTDSVQKTTPVRRIHRPTRQNRPHI